MWASLVQKLYYEVEKNLGKDVVRKHRASIELRCSMRQRRVDASLSIACGLAIATGLYFLFTYLLRVLLCPYNAIDAVARFCSCTSGGVDASEAAGGCLPSMLAELGDAPLQLLGLLPAGLAGLSPFLRFIYTHYQQVKPYLDRSRGDELFEEAKKMSGRADMTESLGFMGKVKTEVEYLYDLLRTVQYHDKELGCTRPLRLCVMIDDLDRCPKDAIVKVLEAVILLLVDAPITCWLAIDSRVVVAAIEESFGVRRGLRVYSPLPHAHQDTTCYLGDSAASQTAPTVSHLFTNLCHKNLSCVP